MPDISSQPPVIDYHASRTIVPSGSVAFRLVLCIALVFSATQFAARFISERSFRTFTSIDNWIVFTLAGAVFGGVMFFISAGPHRRRWTFTAEGVSIERRTGEQITFVRWADVQRLSSRWARVSLIVSFRSRQVLIGVTAAQRQYIESAYEIWKTAAMTTKPQ